MQIHNTHWILVTGASDNLTLDEVEVATQVGNMLAREKYGLIVGDWDGVDWLVRTAFLEVIPIQEQCKRIKHVANYPGHKHAYVPNAEVLPNNGDFPGYSQSAVLAADAGIIVSGREGSKPSMEALLRHQKPVLPIAFLGWDAFEIHKSVLSHWKEQPVPGLTERQFLELMKPWKRNPHTVIRMLRASLVTKPQIFISYRRSDASAAAGRVYDELAHAFGQSAVFIDYASLNVGDDLEQIISQLRECRVIISIIGANWGAERMDKKEDYIRRELEAANEARLKVIPLLVDRVSLPPRSELPESIQYIWDLNFAILQMNDWTGSISRLLRSVDEALSHGYK